MEGLPHPLSNLLFEEGLVIELGAQLYGGGNVTILLLFCCMILVSFNTSTHYWRGLRPSKLAISLLSVLLPFSSHMYSLYLSYLYQTYHSPANSLISVNNLHSFSWQSILSISTTFFYILFPSFLIFLPWSVCAGLTYINSIVTTCILHS